MEKELLGSNFYNPFWFDGWDSNFFPELPQDFEDFHASWKQTNSGRVSCTYHHLTAQGHVWSVKQLFRISIKNSTISILESRVIATNFLQFSRYIVFFNPVILYLYWIYSAMIYHLRGEFRWRNWCRSVFWVKNRYEWKECRKCYHIFFGF